MPTSQKLAVCAHLRRAGNLYFREGQWGRAAERYRRALIYYEYSFPDTPQEQAAMDDMRCTCLLNVTACDLRLGLWSEGINHATQALEYTRAALAVATATSGAQGDATAPTDNSTAGSTAGTVSRHLKALYRRAVAYRKQDEYDDAAADLAAARTLVAQLLATGADTPATTSATTDVATLHRQLQRESVLLQRCVAAYQRRAGQMARRMMMMMTQGGPATAAAAAEASTAEGASQTGCAAQQEAADAGADEAAAEAAAEAAEEEEALAGLDVEEGGSEGQGHTAQVAIKGFVPSSALL